MSAEWMPGALMTVGGSIVTFMLGMWRGQLVTDAKLAVLTERLANHTSACLLQGQETAGAMKEANTNMNGALVAMKVAAAEHGAAMSLHLKTMESILNKLEHHDMALLDCRARIGAIEHNLKSVV